MLKEKLFYLLVYIKMLKEKLVYLLVYIMQPIEINHIIMIHIILKFFHELWQKSFDFQQNQPH